MEEKERYKLESYNEAFCQIHDTESDEWYLRKDLVKDLLNQQDQKIKDLEAKLAYSKSEEEDRTEALKAKLEEKEKEVEYQESMKILAVKNQNQTAIEELEKVKKEINLRPVVVRNCGYGDFEEILLEDVYDVIDNQIKELGGGDV